jgi:tetraacyldisaccharide 4'-kinase
MLSKSELYILDIMKRQRRGLIASLLRGTLRVLSWPFKMAVFLRNWAYEEKWLKQYYPPIPVVISVGNIVSGGTGKTPTTLMIAREFYQDFQIGILTRGHRSLAEKSASPVTLCAGKGPVHSAAYCGDEPFLIAENLPKSFVIVGKNRRKGANLAAAAGVRVAILDDGMQHRQISRDFEVVVMDAEDPLGQGYFLPRGFLRENAKSLSRADIIIVNYLKNQETYERVKNIIRQYSDSPVVGTKLIIEGFYDLQGQIIPSIQDKRVSVFCGIAHPERFHATITEITGKIVDYHFFPDHHYFKPEQIVQLGKKAKDSGAEILICTEKDKVKLTELSVQLLPVPIAWVKTHLQIIEGEDDWKDFINKIRQGLCPI